MGRAHEQHSRDGPQPPRPDPPGRPADPGPLPARHPRRTPLVPPGAQRRRVRGRGQWQPRPAGRPARHPRRDPRRPRRGHRRQREPAGRLRLPDRADEDGRRRQGRPRQARRRPRHEAEGGRGEGPAVRLRDPAALLERFALPADPHHRRGDAPSGAADPRAVRGLPRHHRRARLGPPLPEPRRRQHRPGPRLPVARHRRGDPEGAGHRLALPAVRPDRPLRPGTPVRQGAARQGRRHPVRGGQARPGARRGRGRPRRARLPPGHQHRRPGAAGGGVRAGGGHEGGPPGVGPQHQRAVQGRRRRRRRDGGQDRQGGRDGVQPVLRPQRLGRRHLRQGLRQDDRQEVELPAAQPRHPGPGGARLDLQGGHHGGRGRGRIPVRRQLPVLQRLLHRRPGLQELRVRQPRHDRPGPRPGGVLRHRLLPPRAPGVEEGRRRQGRREGQRPLLRGGPPVRSRQGDRHRPAQRGRGPHPGPRVEAGVLGGQQGLLVQARQEGRRLRRADRVGELPRRQRAARR